MIWTSSILLSLLFGYIGYLAIPKIMSINLSLNKSSNLITQSAWDILAVLIWATIVCLPQFILIHSFKDPDSVARLLSVLIISLFAFTSYKNVRVNNKKLYWEQITSKEHDVDYSDEPTWDESISSIVFNAVISGHIKIKCKIPINTITHVYPVEHSKKPLDIFNSHKYEILPIIQNRIAQGLYDEPQTIIIREGDINNA